jgi:hypothetical protein
MMQFPPSIASHGYGFAPESRCEARPAPVKNPSIQEAQSAPCNRHWEFKHV